MSNYIGNDKRARKYIKVAASHAEIKLLESDWENISTKIKLIKIKDAVDIKSVLIGAILPCAINFLVHLPNLDSESIISFIIIAILWWGNDFLSSHWGNWPFKTNNNQANKVHLEDLTNWIDSINKRLEEQDRTIPYSGHDQA